MFENRVSLAQVERVADHALSVTAQAARYAVLESEHDELTAFCLTLSDADAEWATALRPEQFAAFMQRAQANRGVGCS